MHSHIKIYQEKVLKFVAAREELVESGGPPGKEDINNKHLETVETELSAAKQNGTADPFALYLYGLILIDRQVCRTVVHVELHNRWSICIGAQTISNEPAHQDMLKTDEI